MLNDLWSSVFEALRTRARRARVAASRSSHYRLQPRMIRPRPAWRIAAIPNRERGRHGTLPYRDRRRSPSLRLVWILLPSLRLVWILLPSSAVNCLYCVPLRIPPAESLGLGARRSLKVLRAGRFL
jgi:hypothetical protein